MRHKKLAVFLISLILFFSISAFLLLYEGSPINKYFLEEDAQNLYNQALEFYENKDYSSATSAYRKLIGEYSYCHGFWGRYYDTECARNARMQANETLSVWYYEWAEELYAKGEIEHAIGILKNALYYSPEQSEFYTSRIGYMQIDLYATATDLHKITLPRGISKDLDGFAELIIENDAWEEELNVYLRGPTNMVFTIDARGEYASILPAGTFEIAVDASSAKGTYYGEVELLPNRSYTLSFYVW